MKKRAHRRRNGAERRRGDGQRPGRQCGLSAPQAQPISQHRQVEAKAARSSRKTCSNASCAEAGDVAVVSGILPKPIGKAQACGLASQLTQRVGHPRQLRPAVFQGQTTAETKAPGENDGAETQPPANRRRRRDGPGFLQKKIPPARRGGIDLGHLASARGGRAAAQARGLSDYQLGVCAFLGLACNARCCSGGLAIAPPRTANWRPVGYDFNSPVIAWSGAQIQVPDGARSFGWWRVT